MGYWIPGVKISVLTVPLAYLSTFRNFHGGDSARINVFDPFFHRLSALGKSLGISMGETFFLLTSRLRHNN